MQLVKVEFKYVIEERGRDYALDDPLTYANGGLGANASAVVARVEGRLINEGSGDGILLENGHNILAGDIREIAKDGDLLLLENGSKIRLMIRHLGEIHELKIVNEGVNYNQL